MTGRDSYWRKSVVFIGALICLVVAAGGGSVSAQDAPTPATQPAIPLDAQKLFAQASPAVVKIRTYSKTGRAIATGSGFLIDAAGTIVTNHHVIKDAASARVYIQKRPSLPVVKIVAVDEHADLAIIKVDGKDLPFLKLRVAPPKVGEKVFAIGSPRGWTNTLSDGLVSGLRREGGKTFIQTSTPISHGSSGGPLLSSDGAVVGVTTSGFSGEGALGFAVPAERVARLIKTPTVTSKNASKLLKPPEVKAAEAPKVYRSLSSLLSQMPRNLIPVRNKPFSSLQRDLFKKWIAENVIPGTVVGFTGKLSESGHSIPNSICVWTGDGALYYKSGDASANSIALYFDSAISIHGRKGCLWVRANFDARFAQNLLKLKPGTNVTIHGKVVVWPRRVKSILPTYWYFLRKGDHYYIINLCLTDCAFGKIPLPKKPKAASRPAKPKRTDEDKARSQLALAKNYIGAGLKTKALDVLKELIAKYPKTHAATAAQAELEKLGKQ